MVLAFLVLPSRLLTSPDFPSRNDPTLLLLPAAQKETPRSAHGGTGLDGIFKSNWLLNAYQGVSVGKGRAAKVDAGVQAVSSTGHVSASTSWWAKALSNCSNDASKQSPSKCRRRRVLLSIGGGREVTRISGRFQILGRDWNESPMGCVYLTLCAVQGGSKPSQGNPIALQARLICESSSSEVSG